MANNALIRILVENDLKVTPQRIAILEGILNLKNHPTADNITEYIRFSHPNISPGTIYKTLETFIKKGIIQKINSKDDSMRYDAVQEKHHHLYSADTDRIEDFFDEELNDILDEYFKKKKIPNFSISNIKLQITGKFAD